MKKIFALILAVLLVVFTFAGCGGKEDDALKIGVIQYMSHASLDNCYEGIIAALDESGIKYKVDHQIGSSNSADTDCNNFAKNMVAANYDMIIAIATPAAKAAFTATDDTEIPVIFCAVSDPVAAKLVETEEAPGYLCSGTSDVLDLEAQVDLIQALQPDVRKIGILYTSSEENSITNLNNFQDVCDKRGITVVAKAVQKGSDVPAAAEALATEVDCINNFTDNNVVENLNVVLSAAEKNKIPVYGSEEEQVKKGCVASVSIDYVALGKVTGEMAVDVLGGADLTTMAVRTIKEATPVINSDVLTELGLTLPAAYANATTVTTAK